MYSNPPIHGASIVATILNNRYESESDILCTTFKKMSHKPCDCHIYTVVWIVFLSLDYLWNSIIFMKNYSKRKLFFCKGGNLICLQFYVFHAPALGWTGGCLRWCRPWNLLLRITWYMVQTMEFVVLNITLQTKSYNGLLYSVYCLKSLHSFGCCYL